MLALSDDELDVVMNLSAPLPPANRARFLEAVAAELEASGTAVGPGSVHRVAVALQPSFLYAMPSIKHVARSHGR